jgi:glutamate-1-semialdehyde 2,1-aminomutase
LIFDEVITGFRIGLGGAQTYFNVTPDLSIFGKAMASGYPISVLCGLKEKYGKPLMQLIADGQVIHAGTMNSGHAIVAAALATIEVLERDGTHEKLFRLGKKLMGGLQDAAREIDSRVLVQGIGPMFHFGFTDKEEVLDFRDVSTYDKVKGGAFIAGMQERGIRLIGRGLWYISNAHTDNDIDRAVETAREVLGTV